MKILRNLFDSQRKHFQPGGKWEKWEFLFEPTEKFFFGWEQVTLGPPHARDSLNVQRYMVFVILALLPCLLFGVFNAGYQAFKAAGLTPGFWPSILLGAKTVLPLVVISYIFGLGWEVVFSLVRKHPISEGVFVTAMLFPLTLPPTTPWWQAAMGISFGVVIGKEIFGGTGRNFLNPALTGRAFLYFAYPVQMSGNAIWTAAVKTGGAVDAVTAATPLAVAASGSLPLDKALAQSGYRLSDLFVGLYPASIGASSTLLCLLAAVVLVAMGIASYRIIAGGVIGILAMGWLFNLMAGPSSPAYWMLNPVYHLVMGGAAFGLVFMATDPVSAPDTHVARWIYGVLIGVLTVMIRVLNPAYPEGIMLAILFGNVFAPLLDHLVVGFRLRKRIPNV